MDLSEESRKFQAERIIEWRKAIAQQKGASGLSADVTDARVRASESMEFNLRTGKLNVGMIVSRKARS